MVNFDYMDFERLNGPPMTQAQIDEYLNRIGLSGPVSLNLAGLTRLHQAHQRSVPFENLDVLAGRPISLEREALFEKIVRQKRGGLCSELNTLYNWLLISLGFQVISYNARITGAPPMAQHLKHGEFTITWSYNPPFAFGRTVSVPLHSGRNDIRYEGTAETPCVIVLRNVSASSAANITITAVKRRS